MRLSAAYFIGVVAGGLNAGTIIAIVQNGANKFTLTIPFTIVFLVAILVTMLDGVSGGRDRHHIDEVVDDADERRRR